MNTIATLIALALSAGTVLALASLGLLLNEKAGVVNLGAEGMMLLAAIAGFATTVSTGSDSAGFAAGLAAGALAASLFGLLAIGLNTNQIATGLALSLLGGGLSAFVGSRFMQTTLPPRPNFALPFFSDLAFIGPAFFRLHPMVYLTVLIAAAIAWFLQRSRAGLVLRAVGQSEESAHALGYPVRWIRFMAVVSGGALCGLAGAYLAIVAAPLWVEGITAGRGWIALALTSFASWRPGRVLLGSYLFGGLTLVQFYLQTTGLAIPSQLLSALPYLATIIMLALISRQQFPTRSQ